MKQHLFKFFLLATPFFILLASCRTATHKGIVIASASNMQYALEDISAAFTAETGITCQLVLGSTGKLTAQIREGAPYDIFLAADMKYPQDLYNKGFSKKAPEVYALGSLVLLSLKDSINPSFEVLQLPSISHIAIANPVTAPYGRAAKEVLEQKGLYRPLQSKLVYGENIGQTTQYIYSGAAELGFTARSALFAPELQGKGRWMAVNPKLHKPIRQGILLLHPENGLKKGVQEFYQYLFSRQAREILKSYGYLINE
ncbi:molybdate ABC transporter substrate-binding protein [Robiginitalea sp. IMCC44478]|uniref:molybdate ABC transporter substrate-binding protein n=1 Tax=Robiginitalea sp. IMCC44478 TaxID=3459122 RepID=UPI004041E3BA